MGDHAFRFTDFDFQNKHPNTIIFIGTCTQMSYEVRIKYTGADIETTSAIPQKWLDDLKEKLNEDYDYGPFNKQNIKNIFKNHHDYIF